MTASRTVKNCSQEEIYRTFSLINNPKIYYQIIFLSKVQHNYRKGYDEKTPHLAAIFRVVQRI